MKKPKSLLKQNYYCECSPFYDKLPEEIEVIENQEEFILSKTMTNEEILEENKIVPYTLEQAVGVVLGIILNLKNDWKSKIVYFKEDGVLYLFNAYRNGGGYLIVDVNEVFLGDDWVASDGICLSKVSLTSSPLTPSPSETLSFEEALAIVKKAGCKVIREKLIIEEL